MYSATGIEFIETLNLNEKKQKMAFSRTNSNNQGITNIHGFSKDGKIFVKEIHQNKSGKVYVKEYIQPEKNFLGKKFNQKEKSVVKKRKKSFTKKKKVSIKKGKKRSIKKSKKNKKK